MSTLQLLNKIPAVECLKFLHRVVDGLCGRSYPKRTDYGDRWTLTQWSELLEALSSLFRVLVGKKCSDTELLSVLEATHAECISQCVKSRQEEIHQALVDRTNAISSTQLQDFDWQMKLALSSDKLSLLHTPLLNLTLDVKENGKPRPVTIEMNREELQTLISAMEAANKVVLQLK
ncbi:COMM domain-containing protein 8 [Clupea harengus]|uniref:COMM domain-containing protein 8 n=1 Tax=Clupea harengus TaxID=7950 RepID=A0A6P3W3F6_CLUHA|nr:COMM domain-containing protein 8 [Clupea harengus]